MVHADLQMCQRKFRPMKYTRNYSYANFGTFILGHPVFPHLTVHSKHDKYNYQMTVNTWDRSLTHSCADATKYSSVWQSN